MEKHMLHVFFEPILKRLYEKKEFKKTIDITDLLIGNDEQKDLIAFKLGKSSFACPEDESKSDLTQIGINGLTYHARITATGIEYFEKFIYKPSED